MYTLLSFTTSLLEFVLLQM